MRFWWKMKFLFSMLFAVVTLALAALASAATNCSLTTDISCGFPGITKQECELAGCCYKPKGEKGEIPWCMGSACLSDSECNNGKCETSGKCACNEGYTGYRCTDVIITTVHVVQACHLDVGFAQPAIDIINLYFDTYIPRVLSVAQELRDLRLPLVQPGLKFMFQSYIMSLYIDCPPNMGLHCPNATSIDAFNAGVERGDIVWHAFPFNSEMEVYDPVLIDGGFELTHALDALYGLPPKQTISQRDVPGMTRSLIPILKRNNVTAISVGVNGASTPPFVPNIFRWVDPVSGDDIIGMWHPAGYGGIFESDAVIVPGLSHALVMDWNGDNSGPYTAEQYVEHFYQIQLEFPDAQIVASTFDNFTQYLTHDIVANLPVYDGEIGDTWIYGVPSDPRKVVMTQAMNRAWSTYIANGGEKDDVYLNATRLAIKFGEHTWGLDVKTYLFDVSNYSNAYFEEARTTGQYAGQYRMLEQEWWSQRSLGIDIPIATLQAAGHPLYDLIEEEFAVLDVIAPTPAASGYTQVTDASEIFTVGDYTIGFDPESGSITTLTVSGTSWASTENPLGMFMYRTYSQEDVQHFLYTYLLDQPPPWWAPYDFGKFNCSSPDVKYNTTLQSLWTLVSANQTSFLIEYAFPSETYQQYGASQALWVEVVVPAQSTGVVEYSAYVLNKTTTRMPESMFITFAPVGSADATWEVNKLGEWINIDDIIIGGDQHMHSVYAGVRMTNADGSSMLLGPLDAPVVSFGPQYAYPIPTNSTANPAYGVSSVLWDNLWGTNYVMWWPYNNDGQAVAGEQSILFRYTLAFD